MNGGNKKTVIYLDVKYKICRVRHSTKQEKINIKKEHKATNKLTTNIQPIKKVFARVKKVKWVNGEKKRLVCFQKREEKRVEKIKTLFY